ncbi:GNAT family N-acetyltransferase [Jiangella alba]|uniref:Protein N-acetyltransferase, RimJ/RimL family n=1 Tax=Jiangella alba TaxID=561176 RepID=A0A1H5PGQ2_9ACTN|nr:GNAT family protein [Jiangella alba]SEF12241.1 Protein N-acetyltransferase, RimJ/RimL family [Jiangella alba]
MSTPQILLTGARLALAQPRRDLLPEYHRWENDARTILGYGNQFPQSWEVRDGGWERQRANHQYPQFEVVRLDDLSAVGMTTLDVNQYVRTAEYTVVLAPEARGHGYAAEATRLTLDWAFHLGALRMVWLKVLEPNRAGITAYQRAGFRNAGRLRQSGYWLGRPCDEVIMDAIAEEFDGESWVTATVTPPGPPSPSA